MAFSTKPLSNPRLITATTRTNTRTRTRATVPPEIHARVHEEQQEQNNRKENAKVEETITTNTKGKCSSSSFDNFDYTAHWYPVAWARDIPYDQPAQVTVFDTNYVVAKLSKDGSMIAMIDQCPHKSAALSEGRITSSSYIQCAYHGWSFDGKTGNCIQIPQQQQRNRSSNNSSDTTTTEAVSSSSSKLERFCGTAVPCMIHQGLIWLFPGGGNALEALQAPLPPTIPEIEPNSGFKFNPMVRDFPVDWTILISNIMDPDHGLFAHQNQAFDMYCASDDLPMQVEETFPNNGKSWILTTRVNASKKMVAYDQLLREQQQQEQQKNKKASSKQRKMDPNADKIATTEFYAPTTITLSRVDPMTGNTTFKSCFWVCPTGTGRSRFLSVGASKISFNIPRWVQCIFLNKFLDQDTYLIATQQNYILGAEAQAIQGLQQLQLQQEEKVKQEEEKEMIVHDQNMHQEQITVIEANEKEALTTAEKQLFFATTTAEKQPFFATFQKSLGSSLDSSDSSSSSGNNNIGNSKYNSNHEASATIATTSTSATATKKKKKDSSNNSSSIEKLSTNARRKLFRFGSPSDKLVSRIDSFWDQTLNRAPNRISTVIQYSNTHAVNNIPPVRKQVLDREVQHLQICPDSQQTVQNCRTIQQYAVGFSCTVLLHKLWNILSTKLTQTPAATSTAAAATKTVLAQKAATPQAAGAATPAILSAIRTLAMTIHKKLQQFCSTFVCPTIYHLQSILLRPSFIVSAVLFSMLLTWIAGSIRKEFYYQYTEQCRDRDLRRIPNVWLDP